MGLSNLSQKVCGSTSVKAATASSCGGRRGAHQCLLLRIPVQQKTWPVSTACCWTKPPFVSRKASAQSPQLTPLIGSIHVTEKYFLAGFTFLTPRRQQLPNRTPRGRHCYTGPGKRLQIIKQYVDHYWHCSSLSRRPAFRPSTFNPYHTGRPTLEQCTFGIPLVLSWTNFISPFMYLTRTPECATSGNKQKCVVFNSDMWTNTQLAFRFKSHWDPYLGTEFLFWDRMVSYKNCQHCLGSVCQERERRCKPRIDGKI